MSLRYSQGGPRNRYKSILRMRQGTKSWPGVKTRLGMNWLQSLGHPIISQSWRSALKTQQCFLQGGAWGPHRRNILPKGTEGHIWNMIFLSLSSVLDWWGPPFTDSSEGKADQPKSTQQSLTGNSKAAWTKPAAAGAPVSRSPRSLGGWARGG